MIHSANPLSATLLALRELHAVEVAAAWRLPAIVRAVSDDGQRRALAGWVAGASSRAARLRATGEAVSGPGSGWMTAMVDEAERATHDLPPGAALDAVLVLAMRRMRACAVLGYEALVPVAEGAAADALAANLAEHRAALAPADAKAPPA